MSANGGFDDEDFPPLGQENVKPEKKTVPTKKKSKRNWKTVDEELLRPKLQSQSKEKVVNNGHQDNKSTPTKFKYTNYDRYCNGSHHLLGGYEFDLQSLYPYGKSSNSLIGLDHFTRLVIPVFQQTECLCRTPGCGGCMNGKLMAIRKQVDYYFGNENYFRDSYLHTCLDEDHYISIEKLLQFPRMKSLKASHKDVIEVCFRFQTW